VPIDPIALVQRYHEALNRYRPEEIAPLFAPDASYHSPGVGALQGRDSIIAAFSVYFAEHPDQHSRDNTLVQVGTHSARSEWQLTATSKSTGKPYLRSGAETVTFDDSGLIIRVVVEDR
jgi:uncharacterized protein (TIGR02246 family)